MDISGNIDKNIDENDDMINNKNIDENDDMINNIKNAKNNNIIKGKDYYSKRY